MTQSAVFPSTTMGFSPLTTHWAALRRARVRTVERGSPFPCSPSATVPRRVPAARSVSNSVAPRARAARVAATPDEKNGPGSGRRPISSSTTHISSRPTPLPPYSSGTRRPVQPSSTSVFHSAGVIPAGSSASCRTMSGPHSRSRALRATSCSASCSSSYVKSTASPTSLSPTRHSLTLASEYTVVGYPSSVDFALAPEDEKFRDELRAWLDEHLPPFLEAEALGDDASLSGEASQKRRQAWQRKLNEGGWAAVHWGPEYGGRPINTMMRVIYSEVMAEYRTPGMFNTNGIWQIGPMIIQWGTDEQKAQWLPSILEAEEHWCQGFSEPMAGNDLANLRTTAIYDADTDDADYIVNGSKIWISSAHLATWGLFLLRT